MRRRHAVAKSRAAYRRNATILRAGRAPSAPANAIRRPSRARGRTHVRDRGQRRRAISSTATPRAPRRDHPAFREAGRRGRTLTYGELGERSARVGDMLARHGVEREARVALLMTDTVDLPIGVLGRDQGRRRAGPAQHAAVDRALPRHPRRLPRPRADRLQGAVAGRRRRCCRASVPARRCSSPAARRPAGTLDFAAELARSEPRPTAARLARRMRVLALFLGLDRPAERRAPRPRQPEIHCGHLRRRGAGDRAPTISSSPPPSCSSPMASATP